MSASTSGWQQQWAVVQPKYASYVQQALAATLAALWQKTPDELLVDGLAPVTVADWQACLTQWQKNHQLSAQILSDWERLLTQTLAQPVAEVLHRIEQERNQVTCGQCGVCCRLTSSERSVEELETLAAEGDPFANEFLSVMLPYASVEAAWARFPEQVTAVLSQQPAGEPIHFYHCPYVSEDNRCTLWGLAKRPAMCATYPETPLVWIQPNCHWSGWQHHRLNDTLMAHATLAVLESCHQQLRSIICSTI